MGGSYDSSNAEFRMQNADTIAVVTIRRLVLTTIDVRMRTIESASLTSSVTVAGSPSFSSL
jgi:hypothetical protein